MTGPKKMFECRTQLPIYLDELGELCKQKPLARELIPLDQTEDIRLKSIEALQGRPTRRLNLPFEDVSGSRFSEYVKKLHSANPSAVYIWTERSNCCGLYKMASILSLNTMFRHDVNREGIFSLLAEDLSDNLIFDFSPAETRSGYQVEIDLTGDHWPMVDY